MVLKETWERCIKGDGSYGGVPVGEDDVLELQRGGTGFAAHDKELQVGGVGVGCRVGGLGVCVWGEEGPGWADGLDPDLLLPFCVQAKKRFLLGPGSGLADLRGQHQGPTSKFGLRFNN